MQTDNYCDSIFGSIDGKNSYLNIKTKEMNAESTVEIEQEYVFMYASGTETLVQNGISDRNTEIISSKSEAFVTSVLLEDGNTIPDNLSFLKALSDSDFESYNIIADYERLFGINDYVGISW